MKGEASLIDRVKTYVVQSDKKLTIGEVALAMGLKKIELEELFEKGRFFSIVNNLLIKCQFCGIEIQEDNKASFVCQKCIQKFSPISRKVTNEEGSTESKKIIRRKIDPQGKKTRYGFILNYEL
ncbi:putative flagellar protein [Candidatus Gastranaerophilus sp. (ex Termes propinquus)]|nr:putative flagellar protein [Candidatus Gastranaerophilus sp. (ex Termes propinquus)]